MAANESQPRDLLPGLAVLVAIAVASRALAAPVSFLDPLVLAIGSGALIANLAGVPAILDPGLDRHQVLLETGIVLLGASVPLAELLAIGPGLFGLVLGTVVFGIGFVELFSRYFVDLPNRTGSLLAAGASICGVSAVVAVASSIDTDREAIAYAAGAILLFDAITLVTFPALGGLLALPDQVYGIWVGLVMFSTGPVAAAGFAYSHPAGQWAAITKLVRNAFIPVLAVGYALGYADWTTSVATRNRLRSLAAVPPFLIGFVVVVAIANSGLVSPAGLEAVQHVSDWLFALAFVGVGFSIRLSEMRDVGTAPIAGLLAYVLVIGTLALGVTTLWL